MSTLNGRVAIVTGASKGIGAAIAVALGEAGASVVVNYANSREAADRVVQKIVNAKGKAIAVQADVSKAEDIERLFAGTQDEYGRLDILVNNAGVFQFAPPGGCPGTGVPSRVRHERPRPAPHDAAGEQADVKRWQHRQHQLYI